MAHWTDDWTRWAEEAVYRSAVLEPAAKKLWENYKPMAITHTYAILEINPDAFEYIRAVLEKAGYGHAFHEDGGESVIDMHGIALKSNGELSCQLDGFCAKHQMTHSD